VYFSYKQWEVGEILIFLTITGNLQKKLLEEPTVYYSPVIFLSSKMELLGDLPRIAIVDDDPDIRKTFSLVLSHLGYSVTIFESGTSFVNALTKEKLSFDLVLMDYNMPGMNGIEASKMTHTHLPDVKIILITQTGFCTSESPFQCQHFRKSWNIP
jgi:CheY-like chemotaxis protein